MRKVLSLVVAFVLCFCFPMIVFANCYDNYYSIHGAIAYAEKNAYNPEYQPIPDEKGGDCTNFVSHCITEGGGIPEDGTFNKNASIWNSYTYTYTPSFYKYFASKGYKIDAIFANCPVSFNVNPGDLVIYDFDYDHEADHAAIVVGKSADGIPLIAEHSPPLFCNGSYLAPINPQKDMSKVAIYFIHMTNTQGMTDVTSQFDGREICLYSKKIGETISVDGRNRFTVTCNSYGEAGFKTSDGCYLSVNINENDKSSPAFVREKEQQYWESYRIFTKGNSYYIQSMANGKWLQIDDKYVLRARGSSASTWEEFELR